MNVYLEHKRWLWKLSNSGGEDPLTRIGPYKKAQRKFQLGVLQWKSTIEASNRDHNNNVQRSLNRTGSTITSHLPRKWHDWGSRGPVWLYSSLEQPMAKQRETRP